MCLGSVGELCECEDTQRFIVKLWGYSGENVAHKLFMLALTQKLAFSGGHNSCKTPWTSQTPKFVSTQKGCRSYSPFEGPLAPTCTCLLAASTASDSRQLGKKKKEKNLRAQLDFLIK